MSATYNWAYKPGVANKYNITVNASADNVRPSGMAYVAPFGNDLTGNGSRQYPFRTIEGATNKVIGGSLTVILAAGVYREIPCTTTLPQNSVLRGIIGDGDVILDAAGINTNKPYGNAIEVSAYNITWRNFSDAADVAKFPAFDVTYENCQTVTQYNDAGYNYINNCIYNNIGRAEASNGSTNVMGGINTLSNCTYNNISWLMFTNPPQKFAVTNNIYVNCNLSFDHYTEIDYSLFYNCKFYFGTGTPIFTAINDLASLRAAMAAAFTVPAGAANFSHCIFADPKFTNPSIGDFTLAPDSPAKNASFAGTYIGALPVGSPLKISAAEANGNFDFSTAVNLTINDNSLTITDITQNSQIDTKLIANPTGRELSKLSVLGFTADRNGQFLSSFTDLATTTKSPSDTLSVPTPYLVETGAITYNGGVYQPGDRLTTVAGQTAFTTASGGTLREIVQAPERHTIMARFSDGAGVVAAGAALTAGYWYYVESGSVTYNSVTYSGGSSFKAVDSNSFSGTGVVTLALSTESFQHYEPGIQPTSNNTGDTRTGSIIRGNGDPNYVRGGLYVKEFPINARFFQLRFILQVNNLES